MTDATGSITPSELHETLSALARPRLSGTAGARAVAAEVRERFDALGYVVIELPFTFSTWPGRYGLPTAGLALGATAAAAAWLLSAQRPAAALIAEAAGLLLALSPLVFLRRILRSMPLGRLDTYNLLFTREQPRWLVMAHRDSKSQLAPTLVRTAALVVAAVAWAVLATVALWMLAGGVGAPAAPAAVWPAAGALLAAAGIMVASPARNRSPGALDNATGLAALLALAERVPPTVGFLVTDGEELGLAGARAVADRLPELAGIINLDGLDDPGPIRIAQGRKGRGRSPAAALATALVRDAAALDLETVRRPLPPFVLLDHEPLAAVGRPALTLLKGTWRSLHRVHSAGDTTARLTGRGAAAVATLVAATLGSLSARPDEALRPDDA